MILLAHERGARTFACRVATPRDARLPYPLGKDYGRLNRIIWKWLIQPKSHATK
jgi:hypothetical protein